MRAMTTKETETLAGGCRSWGGGFGGGGYGGGGGGGCGGGGYGGGGRGNCGGGNIPVDIPPTPPRRGGGCYYW